MSTDSDRPRLPASSLALLITLLLPACDGRDAPDSPTAPSAPVVRSLTVVLVRVESAYQATAVAAFSDGSSREVTSEARWTSSNPEVADVSDTGRVTVLAAGGTEIRATFQSVSGAAQLTVAEPPPPAAPPPQRRVSVRVRDALDGAGVRAARVTIVPAGQSDGTTGFTDSAGEFAFTAAWGEYVTVHARQEGYALKAVQQPVTEDTRVDITLDPLPFTLSGTLREGGTGDAVACQPVRVEIVNGPDSGRAIEVRSGPNEGGPMPYQMTNVRPGRFTVRASAPPSAPACGSQEKTDRFRGQPGLNTADFTLFDPANVPGPTIAVNGPGVLVSVPPPSLRARVGFMGTRGQAVTIRLTGNTFGNLRVRLETGGGTEEATSSSNASFTLAATLRFTVAYRIVIEPARPGSGSVTVAVTAP